MRALKQSLRLGGRLLRIGLTNPSRLSHVLGTALSVSDQVYDPEVDLLKLPAVEMTDLLPPEGEQWPLHFLACSKTNASISLVEFIALILLLRRAEAKSVFEFGTYRGVSITQMALNLPPDARIFTLDLPDGPVRTKLTIADAEDAEIAAHAGKGALVPAELRPRVTFLQQDSATFDERPFAGQMDFVFVDGAHNYDYVKNDSEKAWNMLRKGGIVAWHDFRPPDPGVVTYLLNCPYRPSRIPGTTVAFAVKS